VSINGEEVNYGASLSALVTNINAVKANTGVTAEAQGNNLILKGDGVQNVNITNNDYTVATSIDNLATGSKSLIFATASRTFSIAAADVKTGRTVNLTIAATTGLSTFSSQSLSFSYTVQSDDTLGTVTRKFYDLIIDDYIDTQGTMTGYSISDFISIGSASGTLVFRSGMSAGSADIGFTVTQLNSTVRLGQFMSANQYGAVKLQSTDGNPIRINFGENATDTGEMGLVEMNVGDTTYDVNGATSSVNSYTVASVNGVSVATSDAAEAALTALDAALETVTKNRADLGAVQNRLNHTVSNLANVVENTAASQSRILDADFAVEAAALARAQILQQAGTAMLAQANAAPQNVLSLLG
jgi:flagellin